MLVLIAAAGTGRSPDILVLLGFVVFWCALSCLISLIGGWHALARRYRARGPLEGTTFWFVSMLLGQGIRTASYGGCLFVQLSEHGIAMVIFPLLRLFHPPLLIPWSAIARCQREKLWFREYTAIYLSNPNTRLLVAGGAGRTIYEIWETDGSRLATVA